MCTRIDLCRKLSAFAGTEWIETLIKEYEEEVQVQARWPTRLLDTTGRRMLWFLSAKLGVNGKGVPGSACQLLERYLSRHARTFLQHNRAPEEWNRYKDMMASRLCLVMVSCIQLAAKMSDLLAPLTASSVRTSLLKEGIDHTTAEIVDMEFHVYGVLDFRIPLWTSLEISEFLANQVGLREAPIIEALGLVMNLTEFHRDLLETDMKNWAYCSCHRPANPNRLTVHNLHVCAGAVAATARYMSFPSPDLAQKLATLLRVPSLYIMSISDTILYRIIPEKLRPTTIEAEKSYIPILKKRRVV